jgi:hypothetical protein
VLVLNENERLVLLLLLVEFVDSKSLDEELVELEELVDEFSKLLLLAEFSRLLALLLSLDVAVELEFDELEIFEFVDLGTDGGLATAGGATRCKGVTSGKLFDCCCCC